LVVCNFAFGGVSGGDQPDSDGVGVFIAVGMYDHQM